jgi:aspartyl-tRNA(Asn)/glutamyl-tRNA(Gln) amidotransferase subunit A
MSQPYELSATEALRAIRRRELGVVELMQSLLERIAEREPSIGAWEVVDDDGALARARQCEARFSQEADLPLFGLPIGLKDIYATRDLPTTAGFPPWANNVPDYDAATVERVREAGAIVLGKTVTTQFAFADPPRTRNPWNLDRTPGGSSSGSAAAVAARMVPLALGSQTAGSILRPAAYCGVCGLKPTYGLVSRFGIYPLSWSLDHPGPIARSVEDLALALSVLAGPDPRDPITRNARVDDYLAAVRHEPATPTLGVVEDFLDVSESPVRAAVDAAVESLARSGARILPIRLLTSLSVVASAQQTIMQVEAAEIQASLHAKLADAYAPRMRALIEVGQLIPASLYLRAQRLRRRFRREVAALLREVDGLVMPTASNLAPTRETTGDRTFQAPWSLIGLPAVTIPCGVHDGLPVGLQIVADAWREAKLLGIARWAEDAAGFRAQPGG